jgi:hypothetical protein
MSERCSRLPKSGRKKSRRVQSPTPAHVEVPWSVPVPVAEIPQTGRHFDLTADIATREAIAKMAGVLTLPRLEAAFDLSPVANNGIRVTGLVSASVEQACVITLDPVNSQVEERIDLVFLPPEAAEAQSQVTTLDCSEAEDPPETLHNGMIDLGALTTEYLMLGIDPYPRQPDASFQSPARDDLATHPFAALAALKKDSGAKQH